MHVLGTSRVADAVRSPVHLEQARQLPVSSHQFFDFPQSLCVVQRSPSLPSAVMKVPHIRAEHTRLMDITEAAVRRKPTVRAWAEDGGARQLRARGWRPPHGRRMYNRATWLARRRRFNSVRRVYPLWSYGPVVATPDRDDGQ